VKTDTKQNIRHFLKKRHWVSDVFAGMCLCDVPGDRRKVLVEEAPSEGEVLSPMKLLLNEVAVC